MSRLEKLQRRIRKPGNFIFMLADQTPVWADTGVAMARSSLEILQNADLVRCCQVDLIGRPYQWVAK